VRDAFSLEHVRYAVVFMIALVLSIAVHEFGHAITADRLGDRTPRRQGRVTLNPLAHIDPIGTLLFPLMGIFLAGGVLFGWGRPVQVNPMSFTRRLRMKTGHLIVAAAGPAMNLVLAAVVSIVYLTLLRTGALRLDNPPALQIEKLISLNFMLAGLNLIPVPPLDGGTVLAGILPDRYGHVIGFLRQYGVMILLVLFWTRALGVILGPVEAFAGVWLGALHSLALG
jgi:Zn-dependent protease